ncbi:sugar transferase [Halapricum salinum]|uniref:Sugar transferase n=1 Tax=Halapricum salinum TaxID=1457250 RepID=A0A4D6HE06_9EURY|nr:sugar transferase [Halapricum salinum]QCC51781.1 sugar transferase [Halapricum salinum]
MASGWRYRIASVTGVVGLVIIALVAANYPLVESLFRLLPVVGDLPLDNAGGVELAVETVTAILVVVGALAPLYKPRPRRILDVWMLATQRTVVAFLALATIGYFDYTYRLPRSTLLIVGAFLFVTIPAWFVLIRRRPRAAGGRTIIIGDDPATMADIYDAVDGEVIGYVSPPAAQVGREIDQTAATEYTDGGTLSPLADLPCLGGLSRLDEVLVEYDVDTAVLAFAHPDRAEFFGALDTCYSNGVAAKVHRDHAHLVLTPEVGSGELIDIDLEPWDPQDHVIKRLFDVTFAAVGLVVLAPVTLAIAAAIRLDDGGPVLYSQERTTTFGETFTIYKFRTMRVGGEETTPTDDEENPRITRFGRFLRQTHLDEIPQLWSILTGKMSVVGPRAAWTDEETHLQESAEDWRKRWFVKPGLTGLAQINDVSSTDPEAKLRYDVEYIRRQSFWFDLKIVVRQVWDVLQDMVKYVQLLIGEFTPR